MPPRIITNLLNETIACCYVYSYPIIPMDRITNEMKFIPEILHQDFTIDEHVYHHKVFKCPSCELISGIGAVLVPNSIGLFPHKFNCVNKLKFPCENAQSELPQQ